MTAAVIIAIAILLVAAAIPANEGSHAEAPVEAEQGYILKPTGEAEVHTATIENTTGATDKPSEAQAAAAAYEPNAAEVEAIAKMLWGEARGIAAADVLTRYHAERDGDTDAGRVIPPDYCWFTGDGEHNYFVNEWQSADAWGWTLESPYAD